jgi:dolichol kinase
MKKRFEKEILRKLFHLYQLPAIFGFVALRFYFSEKVATFVAVILLMIVLEAEFLRLNLRVPFSDPFGIMRRHEKNNLTNVHYFILALIATFAVFDIKIAVTALLLTTFGDLASSLVGIKYGKNRLWNGKSWQGFFAGLVTNLLVAAVFLWQYPMIFIAMAFTASLVELVTYKLDDNLTVPIYSGFVGQVLAYILGINLVQLTNPIHDFFKFLEIIF